MKIGSTGKPIRTAVLTLSDKGSKGDRVDESGKLVIDMVAFAGACVEYYAVLPDEKELISETLARLCDSGRFDLILTTGGTGVAPRDVTPEATKAVIERELPGMAEAMRASSLHKTPNAMLSRAVAGIRKQTLIVNLPGSPKAARENLEVIIPALGHAVEKIGGDLSECAKSEQHELRQHGAPSGMKTEK